MNYAKLDSIARELNAIRREISEEREKESFCSPVPCLEKYQGKAFFRFHVRGDYQHMIGKELKGGILFDDTVLSDSPMEALRFVKIAILKSGFPLPFRVRTKGRKGRIYQRLTGNHSIVAHNLGYEVC